MGSKLSFISNNIRRIVLSCIIILIITEIAFQHGKSRSEPPSLRNRSIGQTSALSPVQNAMPTLNSSFKLANTAPVPKLQLHFIGTLTPGKLATLTVLQPGKVTKILTPPGMEVVKNTRLIELNNTIQTAQVSETKAGIQASEAQLQKAELGATATKFNSERSVAKAKNGLIMAELKLNEAKTGKDAATTQQLANVTAARQNIAKCRIALLAAQRNLKSVNALSGIGGASKDDLTGASEEVASANSDLLIAKSQLQVLLPSHGLPPAIAAADSNLREAIEGEKEAQEGVLTSKSGAKTELSISKADINAARATVSQAESANVSSKSSASLNEVTSPFAGVIANIQVHKGEIAQPGQPLITLVSLKGAYVAALIPVRNIGSMKLNEQVQLKFSTDPDKPITGVISWISPVVNSDGRSVPVHITFNEPLTKLLLNQYVDIAVP